MAQGEGRGAAGPDGRVGASASRSAILDLIQRAIRHELGVAFLQQGAQDAVAAVFGVHAFLVDAARDFLERGPREALRDILAKRTPPKRT